LKNIALLQHLLLALSLFALCLGNWSCSAIPPAPDKPLRIVQERSYQATQLLVSSERISEATIGCTASGVNILASPVTLRGALSSNNVPLMVIRKADPELPYSFRYRTEWHIGVSGGNPDRTVVYALPVPKGHCFKITQGYFGRTHTVDSPYKYAIDFGMPEGTPVCAARDGEVVGYRTDSNIGGPSTEFSECANYLIVKHADGSYSEYLHLKQNGVLVQLGSKVHAGQTIGLSGNTGQTHGPHLHFCVFYYDDLDRRQSVSVVFSSRSGVIHRPQAGMLVAR